ncbi:MAG TPA: response regulator [Candidatus Udaeobacter sp.]|nr:response regulator [Candidatus Udaeobacter sp.]
MKILIVDDEKAIRDGLKRTIQSYGMHMNVFTADSAEEALYLLREQPIDLVLVDIMMSGMNGIELMDILKKKYPNMIWIVISAYSEFSFAQKALQLGAKDYMLKPVGKKKLRDTITVMEREWNERRRRLSDNELLKINLQYLREAVFRRWAQGLDIGRFDMSEMERLHPNFYLVQIKLETDTDLSLKQFVVENVLSELFELHGRGFVVSLDEVALLGVVSLDEGRSVLKLEEEMNLHLTYTLKVKFSITVSSCLTDFKAIPNEVKKMQVGAPNEGKAYSYPAVNKSDEAIELALQYIAGNYEENLSLEKVASVVYLNPIYFSQVFKQKIGIGYKDYVTNLRLERAKQLLADPKLRIIDIALMVGYGDFRHFSQVFRKKFHMTPSEFRASLGHIEKRD